MGAGWVDAGSRSDPTANLALPNWSFGVPQGFFQTDTYQVRAWAQDKVLNPSNAFQNEESSTTVDLSFGFETQVPVSSITAPSPDFPATTAHYNKTTQALTALTGTANDLPVSGEVDYLLFRRRM